MHWSRRLQAVAAAVLALGVTMLLRPADAEKQLAVYTPQLSFSIDVHDRQGQPYVFLTDLLDPIGATNLRSSGKDWKVQVNNFEAAFSEGQDKATVAGRQFDLGGKVLVENSRPLLPLAATSIILSALLNKPVEFRPSARRIFVDNAATRFTAELKKSGKVLLLLNFSRPVNPSVLQEETRTRLIFKREPLVADANNLTFDDNTIHALSFSEENGAASLNIAGGPGLVVSVAPDGKTITIEAPSTTAGNPPENSQAPAPASRVPTSPAENSVETAITGPSGFFVMIDPGHGGEDQGALLGGKLAEKDITLTVAKRLRAELQDRGIAARLLRETDLSLSLEQRAQIANQQHAGMYIALHAGMPGPGVRVYAPALTVPAPASTGPFVPWERVQSNYLSRSQALAQMVVVELGKRDLAASSLSLPLRPLNNIAAPAIAVELTASGDNIQELNSPRFQTTIAVGVASGIARLRVQAEGHP